MDEVRKHEAELGRLQESMSAEETAKREDVLRGLLLDGARKAEATRATERVKRIGMILACSAVEPKPIDADEIEEMMRVAMDLSDRDIEFLRELVRIEGVTVAEQGRVTRYEAHMRWEQGYWGTRVDPEIDSVFSKLESYGLVSRVPPPNNLNIGADFQNRYVLLKKGLRFVSLAKQSASAIGV